MSDTTLERTRPTPVIAGVLLFSVALIVFVLGVARGNVAVADAVQDGPVLVAPGPLQVDLEAGAHGIWMPHSELPEPEDVSVIDPNGTPVTVTDHGSIVTMRVIREDGAVRGENDLAAMLSFDAPVAGTYTVTTADGANRIDAVIGPADAIGPPFTVVVAAAAALGIVLVLVGLAQLWRARSSPPPSRTSDAVLE